MSADRGEWRGIYTVLQDTPEFIDLPPECQLVWFHLKLMLGAAGIDSVPAVEAVLSELTGLSTDAVSDALATLEAWVPQGSPEGETEGPGGPWLIRQRNVLWLRNSLRHEPSRSMQHANHRRSVEIHISSLPKLKIVNDFADYYNLTRPFENPSCIGVAHTTPDAPMGHPCPITEDGRRNTEDGVNYSNGASGDAPERTPSVRKLWPAKPKKNGSGHYQYPEPFEEAWDAYPGREGANPKLGAYKAFRARVVDGDDPADLVRAAAHYGQHMAARKKEGTPYVQQATTFWGSDEPFREFVDGAKAPTGWEDNL